MISNSKEKMNNQPKIFIKHFIYTIGFTGLGIVFMLLLHMIDFNLLQSLGENLISLSQMKYSGFIVFAIIVIIGVLFDIHKNQLHEKHLLLIEKNSIETFRATMESLNDQLSNFIQSIQLFRIEIDGKVKIEREKEIDEAINNIIQKLRDENLMQRVVKEKVYSDIYLLK